MAQLWELAANEEGLARLGVKEGYPAALAQALLLIRANVRQPLTLERLAVECGVHRCHLARLFRMYVGLSPMKCALQVRLQQAADLLKTTNMSVSQVAWELGFADEYHFSRAFKRWTGSPPSRYRRSQV